MEAEFYKELEIAVARFGMCEVLTSLQDIALCHAADAEASKRPYTMRLWGVWVTILREALRKFGAFEPSTDEVVESMFAAIFNLSGADCCESAENALDRLSGEIQTAKEAGKSAYSVIEPYTKRRGS
jgi:hypothetical protein